MRGKAWLVWESLGKRKLLWSWVIPCSGAKDGHFLLEAAAVHLGVHCQISDGKCKYSFEVGDLGSVLDFWWEVQVHVYVSVLKWGTWDQSWISDREYKCMYTCQFWSGGLGIGLGFLMGSTSAGICVGSEVGDLGLVMDLWQEVLWGTGNWSWISDRKYFQVSDFWQEVFWDECVGGVGGGEKGGCFVGLKFMTGSSLGGLGVSVQFLTVLWWLGNGLGFLKGSTCGGGGEGGSQISYRQYLGEFELVSDFRQEALDGGLGWSQISDRK